MTKNSDEMAFEEWMLENQKWFELDDGASLYSAAKKGYMAAIAHERKRSEKLVKCLEELIEKHPRNYWGDIEDIAIDALKDYKENL